MLITDCHVHIEPYWMMKPTAALMMHKKRRDHEEIEGYSADAKKFLGYLDACGVDRTVLINYPAPETLGFTIDVNDWILKYCSTDPERLLPCGGFHPGYTGDVETEMKRLIDKGI